MKRWMIPALALACAWAVPVSAQPHHPPHGMGFPMPGAHLPPGLLGDGPGAMLVKDKPFQATAVVEVDQPLADGNRIRQKFEGKLARDAAGRIRREGSLGAVGPFAMGPNAVKLVHVHDPVARTHVTLDPSRKVAKRWTRPERMGPPEGEGPGGHGDKPGRKMGWMRLDPHAGVQPVEDKLGTRTIEGVEAEGTRITVTLPAGHIGNEKPIVIVTERWTAKGLGVPVLVKHSDPRTGSVQLRLVGLQQKAPPAEDFLIPGDYKVEDKPMGRWRRGGR